MTTRFTTIFLQSFAILASMELANAGVVISEFRTRGPNGAGDEFVELYNNSDSQVDIGGWKINASNSSGTTGTRVTINAGTNIPARGHFLATNSTPSTGYSGTVPGNQTYTIGITDDGGIALLMADNTIVDQVGMSAGSAYKEGTPLSLLTTNTDQSYERKPGGVNGSTQDTNDNAADFQVRSPSDPQTLVIPGVVTTTSDSGPGSLRQIIADASDGDTITFFFSLPATITLTSGELVVAKGVTIAGPGANMLTVDANHTSRVFHISSAQTATISGLTIVNGNYTFVSGGSGIFNDQASLVVSNCTVSGNYSSGGGFGGIANTGMLTINNSTISGNTSDGTCGMGGGGGGIGSNGTLTINNSTISGNRAIDQCGATFGGGISNSGTLTIDNSTISGNSAFFGGGIDSEGGNASLRNTIFKIGSSGVNIYSLSNTVTSNGYNLSDDNGGGFLTAPGDQMNTDPKLDPNGLQNNGGPTPTIALQSGSPAINAGDPNAPARDQRYYLRNGAPDKGAYEYAGTLAPISAMSRKSHGTIGTFDVNLPLTGTLGVECRSGGATNDHQLVLTFPTTVTVNGTPQAQVTTGTGQIGTAGSSNGGVVTVAGGVVTIPLTNVSNAQRIAVTLFGVSDGTSNNNITVPIAFLVGDSTGDGSVNSSDVSQTKSKSGQAISATNFRNDVTVDGTLNSSDVSFVKSRSGTALP